MNKVLIVIGLVMLSLGISRIASANEGTTQLFAKSDISIQEYTSRVSIANTPTLKCDLNYEGKTFNRIIKKDSQFFLQGIIQSAYQPKLMDEAKNIIEEIGGKYDAAKIKNEVDVINEIEALGGRLNVINGKLITAYTQKTNILLASSKTKNTYDLQCLTTRENGNDLTVEEIMKELFNNGSLIPPFDREVEL